ncbi:MAG: hypothetical protein LC799_28910 [Actinobacteria bacterium]|nr:hypothetical protein [Actinomycetota bacterium]
MADRPGPVVAFRERPETGSAAGRMVHLATVPARTSPGVISTLCGALATLEQIEIVELDSGPGCSSCLSYQDTAEQPVIPGESTAEGPTPPHRRASPEGYAALGWPVIMRGDQVLLILGDQLSALVLPTTLAEQATQILAERARPAPALAHPDAPQHQILITGEPYGVLLPWPTDVLTVLGHLPLPPTLTPRGAVAWVHLPDGHALTFCREIDLIAAIHSARYPQAQP